MSTLRRSEDQAVTNTLLSSYCPPAIKEARERQDAILTKRFQGRRLAIADLGCGDGYHGSLFGPSCTAYHGFEIVPELANMTRERWRREGLDHAEVFEGDVADVPLRRAYYDLIGLPPRLPIAITTKPTWARVTPRLKENDLGTGSDCGPG